MRHQQKARRPAQRLRRVKNSPPCPSTPLTPATDRQGQGSGRNWTNRPRQVRHLARAIAGRNRDAGLGPCRVTVIKSRPHHIFPPQRVLPHHFDSSTSDNPSSLATGIHPSGRRSSLPVLYGASTPSPHPALTEWVFNPAGRRSKQPSKQPSLFLGFVLSPLLLACPTVPKVQ
jgi:hypothetical protein